jgi:hypothetical protein
MQRARLWLAQPPGRIYTTKGKSAARRCELCCERERETELSLSLSLSRGRSAAVSVTKRSCKRVDYGIINCSFSHCNLGA